MLTEIFTLCDSAEDYNGKLIIVGTFNNIYAPSFPATHPTLSIVAKVAFDADETNEKHLFRIYIRKSDEEITLMDTGYHDVVLINRGGGKIYSNFVLRANNLAFPKQGEYMVNLEIDEKLVAQTSIYAMQLQ